MQSDSTHLFVWFEDQNPLANMFPNTVLGQMNMKREILIQHQLYSIEKPKVNNVILHSPASDN